MLKNILAVVATQIYQLRWALLTFLILFIATIVVLNQKVEAISVKGETQWLNQDELKSSILKGLNSHWFITSIGEIKLTAEQVAWVDKVQVKRIWPSNLEITIKEQVPLACWNGQVLTNQSNLIGTSKCLPTWRVITAKKDYIKEYLTLSATFERLEKGLGKKLTNIEINDRGTWKMVVENNLAIVARNKDIKARLNIWIALLENGNLRNIEKFKKVDLRYPNGFAVQI